MDVKSAINSIKFRATDGKLRANTQLKLLGQRSLRPDPTRLRASDDPADLARILGLRRTFQLTAEVLDDFFVTDQRLNFRIMRDQFRVGFFRLLLPEYTPRGTGAARLNRLLNNPKKFGSILTCVNLGDGVALKRALNRQFPGYNFRIVTAGEMEQAFQLVGDQLTGGYWQWTTTLVTPEINNDDHYVLSLNTDIYGQLRQGVENRYIRLSTIALRLAADKK